YRCGDLVLRRRHEARGSAQLATLEPPSHGVSQDLRPSVVSSQLLRIIDPSTQEVGDAGQDTLRPPCAAMCRGNPERRLAAVTRTLGDAGKQQRPASNRLEVLVRVSQAHEDIPPIVDERDHACRQSATRDVVRGKTAPRPLVLQLVEAVLTIGAVAVKLGGGENLGIERRDEDGILVELGVVLDLGKTQSQLIGSIADMSRRAILQFTSQDHDIALPAPTRQPEGLHLALPALTGVSPPTLHKCAFYQLFHVLRQLQLEQVIDLAALRLAHHTLAGNAAVAAQQ